MAESFVFKVIQLRFGPPALSGQTTLLSRSVESSNLEIINALTPLLFSRALAQPGHTFWVAAEKGLWVQAEFRALDARSWIPRGTLL